MDLTLRSARKKSIAEIAQARRHVELLTGGADAKVCIRLLHDQDDGALGRKLTGTLDNLWPQIEAAQAEGYGAFIVVNEGGHRDEDITRIRAHFIDADDLPEPVKWHLEPSMIVRRDARHWHAYWFVADVPAQTFRNRQKRLAAHYGTDPAVCNPSRVMRLAGTLHLKASPKLVTIEDDSGQDRWELIRSKVMTGIPKLEEPERKATSTASGDPVTEKHLRKLLSYLDPNMPRDTWRDVVAAIRATPLVDDADGTKRLQIALEWSRGELDTLGRYESAAPVRYTGDGAVEKVFDSMPPKADGVSYGTIFKLARDGGYEGPPAGPDMQERFGPAVAKLNANEPAPKRSRYYPVGTDEMENATPPDWLVHELIQVGTTVLMVGETQSYKSFLALDIALAIAAGVDTFGSKPKQGPTFYAALEGLHAIKGDRRRAWCHARQLEGPADFYALPAPPIASEEECQEFIEQVTLRCDARPDRARPRLIVLETANKIMGGLDENSAKDAGRLVGLCDRLVQEFGCAVLMIHHKSDKANAADIRGSSAFRAGFDTFLEVDAHRPSRTVEVRVAKHKDAAEREAPWTFQGHVVGPSLVFQPITPGERRAKIKKEDPYSRTNVGAILKAAGAIGQANGIPTTALARRLHPHAEGQSSEEWERITSRAGKKLSDLAADGEPLESYADKSGPGKPTIWYLPEKPDQAPNVMD